LVAYIRIFAYIAGHVRPSANVWLIQTSLEFPSAYDPLSQLKKRARLGTGTLFVCVGLYFSLISIEVFGSSARAAPLALC